MSSGQLLIRPYLDEEDIGTSFGQCDGYGLANAASSSGDDGRVALEGEQGIQ
jgi:hypothetical protein